MFVNPKKTRSVYAAAVAGIFSIFGMQQAAGVLIDFDSIANGTKLDPNTPISGVTFSLDNGKFATVSSVASVSYPYGLMNAEAFTSAEPVGNLSLSFAAPVDNLSFNVIYESGDLGLEIFHGHTKSLLTHFYSGGSDMTDGDLVDLAKFSGVTSVTLTHAADNDIYLIDNVRFDLAAVPEPSIVALLGAGLLGLAIVRRRKPGQASPP